MGERLRDYQREGVTWLARLAQNRLGIDLVLRGIDNHRPLLNCDAFHPLRQNDGEACNNYGYDADE